MTNKEFAAWRQHMGWTKTHAAQELGLSPRTIENYERGRRSGESSPAGIPRSVHLACLALKQGIRLPS